MDEEAAAGREQHREPRGVAAGLGSETGDQPDAAG